MPERADDEGSTEAAVAGGEDRISALPDDVLRHLLSFLPSRNSVRTCVLAKRWRTLWKSVPALRIVDDAMHDDGEMERSRTFVDELLRLRDPTPLEVCDIYSSYGHLELWDIYSSYGHDYANYDKAFQGIEPWLEYALSHQVEVLRVKAHALTTSLALVSLHLKRLELTSVTFEGSMDFSSCPVLHVLKMTGCSISSNILSQSLRHLKIRSAFFDHIIRSRISAPNLITFKLDQYDGLTPLLDIMPSLVTASVVDVLGFGHYGEESFSLVLEGLSRATNLDLRTLYDQNSVFIMDLKWRPMFNKLKTLSLNEWCMDDDFTGLVYFLQHAPVLEMFTLHLYPIVEQEQHVIETDESYNSSDQSFLSKHLKVVKIIGDTKEDPRVHHILKFFCTHGVPSEKIHIQ
ncbi:F-box/LRR-repeat protein 25-like [Lolium perenne]|uniref:F-box/LRR-repeat protein 25-like n=1 Tax=Lolium perenne TaxID=4522 RepID=UPI0021F65FB5|nr:F-box/LRR-repeat protein 25-like [Lolium perenne]